MTKATKKQRALTMSLVFVMVFSLLFPVSTDKVHAFTGKKGSTYEVVDGGQIWYGTGAGGSSLSRKTDLGDGMGSRYSYCVQPDKPAGPVGTMTVDKVVTDDNDTGKWNALRNIVYYSPSYPGYEDNVKNIKNASFYTGDWALDWGVAHLSMAYVYAGRPDDLPTYMGTWASDLGDVWTKAKQMGDALWGDGTARDDAVPENFKVFISFMSGVQDMVVGYLEAPGMLTMTKASNRTAITADNSCYSLSGAEYTVFNGDGKVKGKLTVGSNGKSNTLELDAGTYTVKETKAPKGYAKDTKSYSVTIESEETSSLSAKEEPITDPVELLFTKTPKGYKHDHGEGDGSLKGAVYKFSYFDGQYDTAAKAEASGGATATWYFVTDAHGKISGQNPELSKDYTSSALYKDKDGKVCYPLGTYVIQEREASTGYLVNDTKYVVHVTEDGTDKPSVRTYNESIKGDETIIHGGVKISKIDNDLSDAYAQGDASLKDAEFTIYNDSKESVMVNGKEYAAGEAVLTIRTDNDGFAESGTVLPFGTYSIEETDAPNGYILNEAWEKSFTIRSDREIKDFTGDKVRDAVKRGGVQIVKRDKELEKSEAQGGASLEDIVMTIKNVSAHDVVVRSDISKDDTVDWTKLASKATLFSDGRIKRVKSGEDVGKITVHWNEEKQAYTAETLPDDLPYGTYTIRESRTNETYQRTDKTEHRFEVREDGTVYAYDNGLSEILTFDDYVYRSDVQGTKIGDSTSERFSYVPFKIISVTNGETHVVVTDKNGFFSTKDRRPAGALDEDEDADTARKQNPFDDLLEEESITKEMIAKRSADIQMGVWFGTGEAGSIAAMNSNFGALPYDTYILEEMPCEQNEGYTLQKFSFTVDDKTQNGEIDLETITDDAPEIGTTASVDGENVDVTPKKDITLIDTIEYKGLKRGETYTAKGKLVDKSTGETMRDAKGNEITAETEFTAKRTDGKAEVTFVFDGSNMYGKETVVFESLYDADGRIAARHEDIDDEDQTVTWEKLDPQYEMYKIRTTKAPSKGDKYGFFAQDEVEYEVHVENTGNIEITTDVRDEFTESPGYFTVPELKDVMFSAEGTWNNKGSDPNTANITLAPGETAVVTYTARVDDVAKEYLAAAAKDSDSLDDEGRDTNKVYQKNETDDKDGYVNTAYCENTTYPKPENPDEEVPLEPKEDVAQTPVQKPEIETTLTDQAGRKEVVASEKTVLVDTVSYTGLDKSKWYIITGTLIVKDTAQPLVENGEEITVTSKPFKPWKANGKVEIEFEINTKGLEGKELVAYETAYRLDDYKKGDDIRGAKKTEVASHRDINDKGQTVKIVKPDKPGNPVQPEKPYHAPKTGDPARTAIPVTALLAAFFVLLFAAAKKMKM